MVEIKSCKQGACSREHIKIEVTERMKPEVTTEETCAIRGRAKDAET